MDTRTWNSHHLKGYRQVLAMYRGGYEGKGGLNVDYIFLLQGTMVWKIKCFVLRREQIGTTLQIIQMAQGVPTFRIHVSSLSITATTVNLWRPYWVQKYPLHALLVKYGVLKNQLLALYAGLEGATHFNFHLESAAVLIKWKFWEHMVCWVNLLIAASLLG